jgi:glycosyltransferase involved in cell wall biosynthesis
LAQVIETISALAETDLFVFVPARRSEPCALPDGLESIRLQTVVRPRPSLTPWTRLRWLTSSSHTPLELVQEAPAGPRRVFEDWTRESYDVVWFSRSATYELLGRPTLGPTIVDIDDLEDQKILTRLATTDVPGAPTSEAARFHRTVAQVQARVNAGRWSRLQHSVAATVDRVVLCSDLDARRSGLDHVAVIPNGYEAPARPLGRDTVGDPPTLLLAGSFVYPPNADAAQFLVTSILPRIKERLPNATVRLIGEPTDAVSALDRRPDVTVTGRIPEMEPELARADLVVVPLRFGSGTRVKILEAAAHRIPVVSTTLGAEGLAFEGGRHLLVADEADDFADACVQLLEQPQRRRELVDEAQKIFLAEYQWGAADARIRTLVQSVAHQSGPSS